MELTKRQSQTLKAEKKALDSLIINDVESVDLDMIQSFIDRGYLIGKGPEYELTQLGIDDYMRFYYKPDFIDQGPQGLFGF